MDSTFLKNEKRGYVISLKYGDLHYKYINQTT